MKTDSMTIEILADGSLKVSVDPVSAGNHMPAEKMLLEMFKGIGADRNDITTTHKHGGKYHTHTHGHDHKANA